MRRLVALAAMVLAVLALAAGATAKPIAFHRVGVGTGWGATDGVRYAMFPQKRSEVVVDTHGGGLAIRHLRLERCSDRQLPWNYLVGGARIVGQCPSELVVQRISSGAYAPAPYIGRPGGFFDYFPSGAEGDETHATLVGSSWIEATVMLESSTVMRYLDYRTGVSRNGPTSPAVVADVNLRRLTRPLCSPITRAAGPFAWEPLLPLYYDGSRAIGVQRGGPAALGPGLGQQVTIQSCGQPAPRVLANCNGTCADVQYARGVATWETDLTSPGGWLYAYSVRSGRLYRWSFARFDPKTDFPFARIAHAGRRLFVTSCSGDKPKERCRVSVGLLRR